MKQFFSTYKNPVAVLLTIALMSGLYFYSRMQTSLFPEITFPKVKIIADAGEQPVDKMMVTVTKPLENAVKLVPDLQLVRSVTSRGSCEISAYMNWNANIDLARQNIESRINEIRNSLPPGVQFSIEKMNPSILPVMGYTLESHSRSPIEMKLLAMYTIKPFLSQVEGVAEIRISGGKNKEFWLMLKPQKMSALGVTPDMVNTALSQTNFILSNGYLADYRRLYLAITNTAVKNLDQLENLIIFNDGRRTVQLKDISEVQIREGIEYIRINANGHDAVLVAVIKQPNANLIAVSSLMQEKIRQLKMILPADVTIKPYYIQADFVNEAVRSVTDSLWIGLALAILVAILFLRSARASLTILITIPITLMLTILVLYSIGYTLNIMTLGAIAASIGLIIDDAIVVVEQIHRTHEEHPGETGSELVQKAISYLFPAMLASSISTIVIFLPFSLMTGIAGAYFNVLTNTMIITLVCSFFVTWIGLPVIYLLLNFLNRLKKKTTVPEKEHPVHTQTWVYPLIRRPWISMIFVAGLVLAIVLVYPYLGTGFLPDMDEGSIVLDYSSPPGTSLEETDRMLQQAEKLIRQNPNVEAYSRRTGTQMGFYITEQNRGDYLIQLKKNKTETTDQVIDELRKKISGSQPALRIDFGQVITDMLGDLMASVQPIELKVFGSDQSKLNDLSNKITDIIAKVPGTADAFNGIVVAGPSIEISPDQTRLAQFHLSPAVFQQQLQSKLEGNQTGGIIENQQVTPIRMIEPEQQGSSLDKLRNQLIFLPNGKLVPVSSLATINISTGAAELQRENLQSMGVITARLNQRDLGSVMNDIRTQIGRQVIFPPGYHIEYGGAFADQQRSFNELLIILGTASLLVFVVILFLSRNFAVAVLVLFISVLGAAGSMLALFLTHIPLNVGSYTGIIMIVGIIGENAIFTFWQFQTTVQTSSVEEAVVYAISTRLRPKLMTALGAIIALMPLALGIGVGAQLHQPLAIAVIGGFIVALPLLLMVLPSLMVLFLKKSYLKPAIQKFDN